MFACLQSFKNLFPAWLTLSGNTSADTELTCFGDSGGPHFLGDSNVIVSLTATGGGPCKSTEVTYRIDTPSARQYLADQGIPLP